MFVIKIIRRYSIICWIAVTCIVCDNQLAHKTFVSVTLLFASVYLYWRNLFAYVNFWSTSSTENIAYSKYYEVEFFKRSHLRLRIDGNYVIFLHLTKLLSRLKFFMQFNVASIIVWFNLRKDTFRYQLWVMRRQRLYCVHFLSKQTKLRNWNMSRLAYVKKWHVKFDDIIKSFKILNRHFF